MQDDFAARRLFQERLGQALRQGDVVALQNVLSRYLGSLPYVLHSLPAAVRKVANYEVFHQSLLYVLLQAMDVPVMTEAPTLTGRLDWAVEMGDRISILELKVADNALQALKQVFVRDYAALFRTRVQPVTVYGLQFGARTHTIQDRRTWELGQYDARAQRWEHEPVPVSLAALAQWTAADRKAYVVATSLQADSAA